MVRRATERQSPLLPLLQAVAFSTPQRVGIPSRYAGFEAAVRGVSSTNEGRIPGILAEGVQDSSQVQKELGVPGAKSAIDSRGHC